MTDHDLLVSIQAQIAAQIGAEPVPVPPNPNPNPTPIPPTPPHTYPGPDLWVYPHKRLDTGDLPDGGSVEGGFTVPNGWAGVLELPISGAYLHAYIDDVEYTGPMNIATGPHNLKVKAQGHTANGSVDVVHTP